ncbi:hypothetical protein [Frigidibacter sp.]|uniref:hypothetical protein n=1 Tax=Frigidibacter sp. TaxID=2586418 RepID=UPI00273237F9|nr:hypothetical protein [Frigidibacter sp.]MDP3339985.1 hypothetical protein [Frigidibacter sp.]
MPRRLAAAAAFALAAALPATTSPANAAELEGRLKAYAETEVAAWVQDPVLIGAILAANTAHAALTPEGITALDLAWRAEVGAGQTPTITPVVENAASDFLRAQMQAAGGAITEVFVMDAQGLNVAASGITSDYWQGDEEKFSETYPAGPGALHLGAIELDESTQIYQAQVSMTVTDPATGQAIGAITVALNAEML